MARSDTIRLHSDDNVVVARKKIAAGTTISEEGITVLTDIPGGHKVASTPISSGTSLRKYNQIIGFAASDIAPGEHVHVHNVEMRDFDRDYAFGIDSHVTDIVPLELRRTFQGFRRKNGKVGTRNYIGVLSSVNCSASVCQFISQNFPSQVLNEFANVDGVVALTHSTGCGMADSGDGFAALQRTLWGYARHPNFAGVLLIGLGCEVNQIDFLLEAYQIERGPLFRTMTLQETGGTRQTFEKAVDIIKEMLPVANNAMREPVDAGELSVALQCGGSDAYSGITANPALGNAADRVVAEGGTVILAETPEIYGAEHLLTRRAANRETGYKLIERIRWWEHYTKLNNGEMNNNPSPGNKAGGLTTILEKSLGAAAKAGTTNLCGVYRYSEPITARGFVFMDSPGYDPCSVTGQVASGANVICFTTGRGSCFGFKPTPSIKLATNSPMFERMKEDMDINCGTIIDSGETIEMVGARIFDQILNVASGQKTKSEKLGIGDHEFIPWQIGAVM
ncbi:MAG: altronate dehydratase family protein [Pseudomonadota bacterium]